jgi:hypothetical protein
MEPRDAFGCCLGSTVFTSKMKGAPATIMKNLIDEELELSWPVFVFMMQLDGTIKWWQFYNTSWSKNNLLSEA